MRNTFAALTALTLTSIPVHAAEPTVPKETLLTVSANGESTRVPDIAILTAGVVTQAPEARAAMQANNNQMVAVMAALKKAGIAERDVQTSNINLNPQYRYKENQLPELVAYQAQNNVTVKLRSLSKAGDAIDALVTAGANQVNGPSFSLDKPEEATDEARIDAMQKARARAELYAKAAGMTIKRIVSINESGGYQPPYPVQVRMMKAEAADAAAPPVSPGEVGMSVSVTIVYELQ